jgi:uncharacterized protein with PIN domain
LCTKRTAYRSPAGGAESHSRCSSVLLTLNLGRSKSKGKEQARIAREAFRDFGKGSGHAAQLNFGDCFAYALAKAKLEPLLFKGGDFRHTDVSVAV